MKKVRPDLNHSCAHLLASAVLQLFPNTKLGIGPAIDEGFYYDFEFENPINDQDLLKIEKTMKKIAQGNYEYEEILDYQIPKNQTFKWELFNDFKNQNKNITFNQMINKSNGKIIFTDLCKGNHIHNSKELKFFKLLSFSGAYWKGDSKNTQLTRIYGTSWETQEELDAYLFELADRKERDHRKIGKELEIFTLNPNVGQGCPIWLKNGYIVKEEIQKYLWQVEKSYGFTFVKTPDLGSIELYKTSGHLDHYRQDMFPEINIDNEILFLRPMACPHHIMIYKQKPRSYKELPMRLAEHAQMYRYEKSGALIGLERVRRIELTDAHIFCSVDQIAHEIENAYALINEVLNKFDIKIDYISLSLNDPEDKEKYYPDSEMWEKANAVLENVLNSLNLKYEKKIGEAAFYGPKIDIQVKTALGHEITLSTLQLDFLQPKNFDLTFINSKQEFERPVMIHRGLIGSFERFISILLEQTKGNLPLWLAPIQIAILPIADAHKEYGHKILDVLKENGFRVFLDDSNETLNKRIRNSQIKKIKYQIIIGNQEIEKNQINVRFYGSDKQEIFTIDEFIVFLKEHMVN